MPAMRTTDRADFTFESANLDAETFHVLRFHGTEGISQLWRFQIELVSDDAQVDLDSVVGEKAVFTWMTPEGERWVHGIVGRLEQTGRGRRLVRYSARLVPKVWTLTLRQQSRIFQNKATPDILKEVLETGGIPSDHFKLSLKRSYKPRKYCTQYRESDFDFLSRLMEEEGIFYHFEHTDKGHVLVMGDDAVAQVAIPGEATVPYEEEESGLTGGDKVGECVTRFRFGHSVRSGAVVMREFDFKKPTLDLKSELQADKEKQLEVYDYPGEYPDTSIGKELVKIRLEEQRAERALGQAEGNCRRLVAGYRFTLDGHWNDSLNQEYLLVRVQHWGEQPQAAEEDLAESAPAPTYHNHFDCIPVSVAYRPARITPRPRVEGPQTAIVTGASGEEIHTDEHGRVKVHFHWDRLGPKDDKSSCWIRVSQGWGGAGWGAMFLPRVGQEVIVEFLEGDPDRPIITGRVYNADNPPPYGLPAEKTKSTIKSSSSPGGDGCNEVRFEDKKGDEQILVQAEKDIDLYVKNDSREWVGRDRHLIVTRDRIEEIQRDEHDLVQRDQVTEVTRDQSVQVGGKQMIEITGTRSLSVTGDVHESSKASHSHEVTKNLYLKAMGMVVEGMQELTLKVGSNFVRMDSSGVTIVGSMVKINSGGSAGTGTAVNAVPVLKVLQAASAASAAAGTSQKGVTDNRPTHQEPKKNQPPPPNTTWVELELVDEAGQPVPGEPYEVELADGKIATGTTGADGVAHIGGIKPGTCKFRFPRLDKDAWEKA